MMGPKQTRIVIGVIVLVLLACLSAPLLSNREPTPPQSQTPISFNATLAYQATREFVTQFPRRVIGTFESRQSTGYLHDYLANLGYTVDYSHFDARTPRLEVGRNVLAHKRGQSSEILALVAHFDTARTTVEGAMQNGAAVGVLLELARLFAASSTRRSLLYIFSDGEEWGMLGAQDLADSYPERNRIVAVLSLDHVSMGDLAGFCLEETGQLKGFTPPWLRQLARRAAETQGLPVSGPSGFREYIERAMLISWADQGPFLKAGIPAIDLGSESADRIRERAIYHSPQDTMENLTVASFEKYGLVAERIVRALDELPSIPRQSSEYFRLWDALYLRPGMILALQIIVFLPLPVIFFPLLRNHGRRVSPALFGRELLALTLTILPFWSAYLFIRLARALRLLPLYSLYPAPMKDPVLENPPWGMLGGIFAAVFVIAIICYVIGRYSLRSLPKPEFHVSKLVLLSFTLIMAVLALRHNSYWASAFVVLPAWIWAMVGSGQALSGRTRNGIWILAAGIPYYVVLWMYASRLQMSWNFIWYQMLALSTGMFSAAGFFLGTAAIALGIRFLAIQWHHSMMDTGIFSAKTP
jgi:hypothetical protein